MMNPKRLDVAGGAHTARLVWVLASLGLGLGAVMLAISGWTLRRIHTERSRLSTFQPRMVAMMARFDQGLANGGSALSALLDGGDVEPGSPEWIEELTNLASEMQKVAHEADAVLEVTGFRDQCEAVERLYEKCVDWNHRHAELMRKLPMVKTEAEWSLERLREAIDKAEGRIRLRLAVKTRQLDRIDGSQASQVAREIVKEIGLPTNLTMAKAELVDLALLSEKLWAEDRIDYLTDIKDNQFRSTLERFERNVHQIKRSDAIESEVIQNLLDDFKLKLFGEGFSLDGAHQTIVPGGQALFTLTRDRLTLQGQRAGLLADILRHMEQLRVCGRRMNENIHVCTAELTLAADLALTRAWRIMLFLCLTSSGVFAILAARIAQAVKNQLVATEIANRDLCIEIERRKQAQKSLREERDFSESLVASLPGVFYVIDEQGRMVKHNRALEDTVGYSSGEVIGMSAASFFKGAERALVTERVQEVFAKGHSSVEAGLISKAGQATPHYFTGVRAHIGDADYLVGVGIDITDRRLAEQKQGHLIDELQKANSQLEDFAHVVSHDLKAPLRGVKILADWLLADFADKLGDDGRRQLELLVGRVNRMRDLIDGILKCARVAHNQMDSARIDLNEIVPRIIDMIGVPENITINLVHPLPVVEGVETHLAQVFQNLLSNAVKYMDKENGLVEIDCTDDSDRWRFSVRDNGPGIESQHFDRIFRLFQTLTARDEFESTGVGLTLVKKIVELHNGSVWVESELGQGSTFFFTFPKCEPTSWADQNMRAVASSSI